MSASSNKVTKRVRIDPAVLERARALLGTTTDSDTIEQALDLIAFKHEAIVGVQKGAGQRLWTDVFGDESPPVRTTQGEAVDASSLDAASPHDASRGVGLGILKHFGAISSDDADAMLRAIREGCERVDNVDEPHW